MKITIKKGLSIQKVNEALQFFAENHDCEFSYPLILQKDVSFELITPNSYGDNLALFDEYIISPEYVNKMDNIKRKRYECDCQEILFPHYWWQFDCEISAKIKTCQKELNKFDKLIKDAPAAGRLPKTIEKYEHKRILLQHELSKLEQLPSLYDELDNMFKHGQISYGYVEDVYAILFTCKHAKYAFTLTEYNQSHLFEITDESIVILL